MEPFLQLESSKIKKIQSCLPSRMEQLLLAVKAEFKIHNKNHSGYFALTYGTSYLFKTKAFGGVVLEDSLHPLDIQDISVDADQLTFSMQKSKILIKSEFSAKITSYVLRVLGEMTYHVPAISLPSISSTVEIPSYEVSERAPFALRNRIIFLTHYYDINPEQVQIIEYFDKWEEKGHEDILTIGPSFHPGIYSGPVGHAIAWEADLHTIVFQNFHPNLFKKLLHNVVRYSVDVHQLVFANYNKPESIPILSTRQFESTNINTWYFTQSIPKLVMNFLPFLAELPDNSIKHLRILNCSPFDPKKMEKMIDAISHSKSFSKLQQFIFGRDKSKVFPFNPIREMCNSLCNLRSICIRSIPIDGSTLLHKILTSRAPISVVRLNSLPFKKSLAVHQAPIPPTLVNLDISGSLFFPKSLRSLLEAILLTPEPIPNPIIFEMNGLNLKMKFWEGLRNLKFESVQPNFLEVSCSNNMFPGEEARYFFGLLFTQSRMKQLTMTNVSPQDGPLFIQFMTQLVQSLQLDGIDFSSRIEPDLTLNFINVLRTLPNLKRVCIPFSNTGDSGIEAIRSLIEELPDIRQITCDGINPNRAEPLFELWKEIGLHPTICECDRPIDDMKSLGLKKAPGDALDIVNTKPIPANTEQRTQYLMSKMMQSQEDGMEYNIQPDELFDIQDDTAFALQTKMVMQALDKDEEEEKEDDEEEEGDYL